MSKRITLGSLFDGIGGFPLSGVVCGIEPVWASEIEPFPIAVTMNRFPNMKHLGSVTDINGAEVEPVDIITFGSPCQDLSVAGLQKGIHDGERSNLFFQAVRIIKEMRDHDRESGRTGVDVRCRWAVWENVPGAFSSNKGRDFQAVLQALCEVADSEVHVPFPEKGKWQPAGCIVGDGYSVAWRVYDAQHWGLTIRDGNTGDLLRRGTPQRRKRIYLVADFGSERAGEILFESEGVSGNTETSREARQGTADHAEGSAGRSRLFEPRSLMEENWSEQNTKNALRAEASKSSHVIIAAATQQGGAEIQQNGICPTVTAAAGMSGNNQPYICITSSVGGRAEMSKISNISPTLRSVDCKNAPVICLQGNGIDRADTAGCNGKGWREGGAYTLNTIDRHAVVYDCRGNGEGGCVPTLTGDHENRVTDYTAVAVYDTTQITSPLNYSNPRAGDPCHPLAARQHPPLAVCAGNGQLNNCTMAQQSNTLDCMHDQQIVLQDAKPPRKYIVRRLTPLECCRLQGYPDGWTEGISFNALSEEQISQLEPIRKAWAEINGKQYRPCKDRAALKRWFEGLRTDSAEYKAYGNSLAIPCSYDVISRIAKAIREGE